VYQILPGNVGYRIFGFRVGQDHAAMRLPRGCLGERTAIDASDEAVSDVVYPDVRFML
jgi:hypothetical protein